MFGSRLFWGWGEGAYVVNAQIRIELYIYSTEFHCMFPKLSELHWRGSKCDGAGILLFFRDVLFTGILV